MNVIFQLRVVVYLRRLVVAAESIADSQRTLASLAQSDHDKKHRSRAKSTTDFSSLDVREANRAYHRDLIEQGLATAEDFPEDQD
jgi:hypothetical protein